MLFRRIEDPLLAQYAYLVGCQRTKEALVIDPERDVDRYIEAAAKEGLRIVAVTETHIHADFLSGARDLAHRVGATAYLSAEGGDDWQYGWAGDAGIDVRLLRDGDTFRVGNVEVRAVHTPGHTPEHLAFLITDHGGGADAPLGLVSGDFVFVGDVGRPDLLETAAGQAGTQEASARRLYASLQQFLGLDGYLLLWPGHGAGSACGKALGAVPVSSVGYEQRFNAAVEAARRGEGAFVRHILEGQPDPPLYFGRMKRVNRDGPPRLDGLPQPHALGAEALDELVGRDDLVVLDTRPRAAFVAGHLPGALHCPLGSQFPIVAGGYVEEGQAVALVVDEADLDLAVRACVRVGTDRVEHWVPLEALEGYRDHGGHLAALDAIDFEDVEAMRARPDVAVLDVRQRSEFAAGHVPGALHAPHARLPEHKDALPREKTLLVHCQSGVRSAVAAAYLEREGFDVRYVAGAFPAWARAHPDAVVREAEEQPA
ncbi:MAG TPA: rhodanese-like domain-containing protein [Rubricoccaceae bacterium]|nr:rhodanese-like domain-containing protein [Rubricoccaceae bacterium]